MYLYTFYWLVANSRKFVLSKFW